MNLKYKHGITEQGKEMLITKELEEGTVSASVSGYGWTLRRACVYGVVLFSFCVILIILAVTGNSNTHCVNPTSCIYLNISSLWSVGDKNKTMYD